MTRTLTIRAGSARHHLYGLVQRTHGKAAADLLQSMSGRAQNLILNNKPEGMSIGALRHAIAIGDIDPNRWRNCGKKTAIELIDWSGQKFVPCPHCGAQMKVVEP